MGIPKVVFPYLSRADRDYLDTYYSYEGVTTERIIMGACSSRLAAFCKKTVPAAWGVYRKRNREIQHTLRTKPLSYFDRTDLALQENAAKSELSKAIDAWVESSEAQKETFERVFPIKTYHGRWLAYPNTVVTVEARTPGAAKYQVLLLAKNVNPAARWKDIQIRCGEWAGGVWVSGHTQTYLKDLEGLSNGDS